ncbi:hypothetical protein RLEG12_06250 (plasmid) [Rhizobium leguminosarum bv. trifolii CB782]|nr:hypothetical protein RLEG12_06250 [Rhizobium leguminosarum bv. trifolii CB782]
MEAEAGAHKQCLRPETRLRQMNADSGVGARPSGLRRDLHASECRRRRMPAATEGVGILLRTMRKPRRSTSLPLRGATDNIETHLARRKLMPIVA